MSGICCSEDGFTLLEVVVAIVIISLLTVTFAPLIVSSVQRIQWAGMRMQELYALRSEMEKNLATETSTRQQELVITSQNGFSRTIEGIVVESGDFVSFLSPRN